MNKETLQMILDKLDAVAAKLGVAANHIWPIFIRQIWMEGIVYYILSILLCYLNYKYITWIITINTPLDDSDGDRTAPIDKNDGLGCTALVLGVTLTLVSLAVIVELLRTMLYPFNPEYYVVERLAKLLR